MELRSYCWTLLMHEERKWRAQVNLSFTGKCENEGASVPPHPSPSLIYLHRRQRKLKVRHRIALQMTDLKKMLNSQLRQVAYTKVKVLIGKG